MEGFLENKVEGMVDGVTKNSQETNETLVNEIINFFKELVITLSPFLHP